jgi:hypothetical protein
MRPAEWIRGPYLSFGKASIPGQGRSATLIFSIKVLRRISKLLEEKKMSEEKQIKKEFPSTEGVYKVKSKVSTRFDPEIGHQIFYEVSIAYRNGKTALVEMTEGEWERFRFECAEI